MAISGNRYGYAPNPIWSINYLPDKTYMDIRMIKHTFLIEPSAWINQRCPLYGLQEAATTAYSFQPQIAMSNRRGSMTFQPNSLFS